MTDDEIANAVFMNPSIVNTTAAKDRIRWLSRALNTAMRQIIRHANETAPYAYEVAAEATLRMRVERDRDEAERLLAALCRYGNLHQVEGVIYPETGSHKETLDAANNYLLKRAVEKEKG